MGEKLKKRITNYEIIVPQIKNRVKQATYLGGKIAERFGEKASKISLVARSQEVGVVTFHHSVEKSQALSGTKAECKNSRTTITSP